MTRRVTRNLTYSILSFALIFFNLARSRKKNFGGLHSATLCLAQCLSWKSQMCLLPVVLLRLFFC